MKKIQIALCALFGLTSVAAMAEDQNLVAAGIGYISVHSSSPDFSSNGPAFLTPQPAGITVASATTLLFGFSHMLNDHWAVAFAGGIPPKHDINGRGTLAPFGVTKRLNNWRRHYLPITTSTKAAQNSVHSLDWVLTIQSSTILRLNHLVTWLPVVQHQLRCHPIQVWLLRLV